MDNNIGISENRLRHSLGVARKAYRIAKDLGFNEAFCRKMFMLGWVHDVGYEFTENQADHSFVSANLVSLLTNNQSKSIQAVKHHGRYISHPTDEWRILNMADMQIDVEGSEVDVSKRLNGIKEKYGEHSDQYLTACDVCYQIGLTAINLAASIT